MNSSNPEELSTVDHESRLREENDKNDLRWVLSDKRGRRVLWKFLEFCHIFETSFNQSGSVMCKLEGQRTVGLYMVDMITRADQSKFFVMMQDAKLRDEKDLKKEEKTQGEEENA